MAAPSPPLTLEFATNSVRNTTLSSGSDDPYYEIVTRFWHPKITKIRRLDQGTRLMSTVCEIDAGPHGRAAKVRFAEPSPLALHDKELNWGEWVDSEALIKMAEGKQGGIFVDTDGTEYRWKTQKRRFQLVRVGDETQNPVVTFHGHKRPLGVWWMMSEHSKLEIRPPIQDLEKLIVTFLLVERKRRHSHF
ncbi:unnamed protein product [Mycena citricolor]|uniref:DUF6593 domain-containing protein n=1 Tax=Mycena citricolor TaxID=2018698 RepID=A0AAD2H4Y2_9AGAR|nr:unnamed protein product [Mycena citricolor]